MKNFSLPMSFGANGYNSMIRLLTAAAVWLAIVLSAAGGDELQAVPGARDMPGVDPAAYARLLEENRTLRARLQNLADREMEAEQARAALMREVAVLEKQVADSTAELERARNALAAAATAAGTDSLRRQLAAAESERQRLANDLARVRDREQRLLAGIEEQRPDLLRSGIEAGSDLVRERDRENERLRRDLEQARRQTDELTQQRATALGLVEELMLRRRSSDAALETVRRQRDQALDLVDRVMARRAAEGPVELARLRDELERLRGDLETARRQRDQAVGLLDEMMMAQAAAGPVAEPAPAEVEVRDRQEPQPARRQRDMRYNIGVLEARAGRWQAAEREFLAVLEIDPQDADVHYNLAVVYDEGLRDSVRAARHYRRFLDMRPDSRYADAVRLRLMTAPR